MTDPNPNSRILKTHELVIRRWFNCSAERVFKAWTEPSEVQRWWGPRGFTAPVCKVDLRVGGEYHYCTRSPQGVDYWCKGTFREIEKPVKIVATDSFCDSEGRILSASSVGLPPYWPSTLLVTVTFQPLARVTLFTLRHNGMPAEMLESCREGWNEALDKLAAIL